MDDDAIEFECPTCGEITDYATVDEERYLGDGVFQCASCGFTFQAWDE